MATEEVFPVVDLFAGPGGLGEGFASLQTESGTPRFESAVSIENEQNSFRTLHLRHFLRGFSEEGVPEEYYQYLSGSITIDELHKNFPDKKAQADRTAHRISLGPENHETVRNLITEKLKERSKWAIVGGPPCQAYSLAGRSRMMGNPEFEEDIRHFLYREYLEIIADHKPPVFVVENVKGLLSAIVKGESVIDRMLKDLKEPGAALEREPNDLRYNLHSLSEDEFPGLETDPRLFLIRSEDFGVPQARHRVFIVGVRSDIGTVPRKLRRHAPPTLRETIGNLPAIRSGLSKGKDSFSNWQGALAGIDADFVRRELNGTKYRGTLSDSTSIQFEQSLTELERNSTNYPARPDVAHDVFEGIHDPNLDFLEGHEARSHMRSDLRRYAFATTFAAVTGKSPRLADFPKDLLPTHKNVSLGRKGIMFSDRFRVQLPDRPSTTITSHISKDGHYFIHYNPAQCRSLTVREAARLQTFPDNYRFEGPRTAQYHQVGNAVPPYLAKQIAEIVAEVLDRMESADP